MASNLPRGVKWAAVITFLIGVYLIYSGSDAVNAGYVISTAEGKYASIFAIFGTLWEFFGWLYMFLGLLCFVIGAGLLFVKEWARRNGVYMFWVIAIMSFYHGVVLGFYDMADGILPFIMLGISGAMALKLRSRSIRDDIEFHGQGSAHARKSGGVYYSDIMRAEKEETKEKKIMMKNRK